MLRAHSDPKSRNHARFHPCVTLAASASVCLAAGAALAQPLALNYNFNGMAHTGEFTAAGSPNLSNTPAGYRSISDRGLIVNGAAGSFGTSPIFGASGLAYTIVTAAGVPDLIMLGDRNRFGVTYALGSGNNFDNVVDTDILGTMPTWLPNGGASIGDSNLTGPQTTTLGTPIVLSAASQIGVLYNITNGGGRFDVTLNFDDFSSVTVTLVGPDWFGSQVAPAALAGVASQTQLGVYNGVDNRDNAKPAGALNVYEGLITASRILTDLAFDVNGKTLVSITFGNRQFPAGGSIATTTGVPSFAVFAATIGGATPPPANDNCATATPVGETIVTASTGGSTGTGASSCGSGDDNDVWYLYTASRTGTARVSLCGSGFDTTLAVYTGSCASLAEIACNNDYCGTASRVEFPTVQNAQYYIRIAGNASARGVYTLEITNPPGVQFGPLVNPASGHTYYLLRPSDWDGAEADAMALGGHLVTINDAAENDWVRANVLNFDGGAVFRRGWIGLVRPFTTWQDGTAVAYTHWNAGEPNNAGGVENYAEMIQDTGFWNDARLLPGASNCGIVEVPTPPTVPGGIGSASPNPVEQGRDTVITVVVNPAGSPPSTVITVTADLHEFGGSAAQPLADAGSNTFTYTLSVPASQGVASYTINFHVADAELRSSDSSFSLAVIGRSWSEMVDGGGDAGELVDGAQTVSGSGSLSAISGDNSVDDTDLFLINICDPPTFSATTVGGVTWDSQLFLFDANKIGVMHNDDSTGTASTIDNSGGLITAPGNYYLAITHYNRDPVDGLGALIWNNTPFTGVRAPDGPAAANPFAGWTGAAVAGGAYRIALTGACFVQAGPAACSPADIASAGNPDPLAGPDGFVTGEDFDVYILAYFKELRRANNSLIADLTDGTGTGGPDGFVTGTDFDYFVIRYFQGC